MNKPHNDRQTLEENLQEFATDTKTKIVQSYEKYERIAAADPGKAVLIALATGYCLHRLPLRALVVLPVRAVVAVAPALLLGLGAIKLCGILQRSRKISIPAPATLRNAGEIHEGE